MRRAARTDGNQLAVVNLLRSVGATVAVTSHVGGGFPDLVVGWRGRVFFIEVKDGSKPPSSRLLTPAEEAFKSQWDRCSPGTYRVVTSPKDALDAISR